MKKKGISLLLVEDHNLFRKAIRRLLESFGYKVTESANGLEGLKVLEKENFDLIISDLEMPVMNGYEFTVKMKESRPDQKIMILTMHDSYKYIKALVELDVDSYLIKNVDLEELQFAIRSVLDGRKYFPRYVMELLVHSMGSNQSLLPKFSERELEVLRMIAAEKTVAEIAAQLSISSRTVEAHKLKMLEKARVKSTIGLIKMAAEEGLFK